MRKLKALVVVALLGMCITSFCAGVQVEKSVVPYKKGETKVKGSASTDYDKVKISQLTIEGDGAVFESTNTHR